jgi:hypothetical protein
VSNAFRIAKTSTYTGAPWQDDGLIRVAVPEPLIEWLTDLVLLRPVPLHYLVPDPAALPAESLRFVTLDPALVGQLVDGALSAAALGGGDLELGRRYRAGVCRRIACELDMRAQFELEPDWKVPGIIDRAAAYAALWDKAHPERDDQPPWLGTIAGLLIRSELVRRYPTMIVRAAAGGTPLGCVRRDRLAPSVMLVLFHGSRPPDRIELQEPDSGVRFGAEPNASGLEVDYRRPDGTQDGVVAVPTRAGAGASLLDLGGLRALITARQGSPADSTAIARNLQQTPFVQILGHGLRPAAWTAAT